MRACTATKREGIGEGEVSIDSEFLNKGETDGQYAIAFALMQVARSIDRLGNGNASTPMGAIEAYGMHIGEKIDEMTNAFNSIAEALGGISLSLDLIETRNKDEGDTNELS